MSTSIKTAICIIYLDGLITRDYKFSDITILHQIKPGSIHPPVVVANADITVTIFHQENNKIGSYNLHKELHDDTTTLSNKQYLFSLWWAIATSAKSVQEQFSVTTMKTRTSFWLKSFSDS
jgi:hypothetical protein